MIDRRAQVLGICLSKLVYVVIGRFSRAVYEQLRLRIGAEHLQYQIGLYVAGALEAVGLREGFIVGTGERVVDLD